MAATTRRIIAAHCIEVAYSTRSHGRALSPADPIAASSTRRYSDRMDYDAQEEPVVAPARIGPASTIRGALTAGFAVVFVLWVASGYELVRSLREVDRRLEASRRRFSARPGRAHHGPYQCPARIDLPSRRADRSHAGEPGGLSQRAAADPRGGGPRAAALPCRSSARRSSGSTGTTSRWSWATTGCRATWCSSQTGR